jgi:hypothetical protein
MSWLVTGTNTSARTRRLETNSRLSAVVTEVRSTFTCTTTSSWRLSTATARVERKSIGTAIARPEHDRQ